MRENALEQKKRKPGLNFESPFKIEDMNSLEHIL